MEANGCRHTTPVRRTGSSPLATNPTAPSRSSSATVSTAPVRRPGRTTFARRTARASARRATYASDQLSQALDRPLGLKAVTNPLAASGGVDAGAGVARPQVDSPSRAHPGSRRVAARLRRLRARVPGHRQGVGRGAAASRGSKHRRDGRPRGRLGSGSDHACTARGCPQARGRPARACARAALPGLRCSGSAFGSRSTPIASVTRSSLPSRRRCVPAFGAQARDIGECGARVSGDRRRRIRRRRGRGRPRHPLPRQRRARCSHGSSPSPRGVGPAGAPIAAELLALAAGPFDDFMEMP